MGEVSIPKKYGILRIILRRPYRIAMASFLAAIAAGTLLLALPWSSSTGRSVGVVDALFTSTSAVCVTGLVVRNTATDWSLFGQLVILALIQAGGVGIMTAYALLAVMVRQRLSMGFERMLTGVVPAGPAGGIWPTVKFICILTAVVEAAGAVCLFVSWRSDFDSFWRCAYFSVFHSISAFCNAGFSLFSDNLVRYRADGLVCLIICALIVVGGLGFLVARDLKDFAEWWLLVRRGKRARLTTHTKLVLTVTFLLLFVGFVGIYLTESAATLRDVPTSERMLAALFQSVTARTAGYNTIDLSPGVVAPATALLLMVLMFVGGSPGSTAGGVKTTTLGVMVTSIIATVRGSDRAEMFDHSVPQQVIHRVASIILLALGVVVAGTFLLLVTERNTLGQFGFLSVMFETTSAFGTVGLSMGLTPHLSVWGRLIIPAVMFVGRVGLITVLLSAARVHRPVSYMYPPSDIMVG